LEEDVEQEFLKCLKTSSTDISALEKLLERVNLDDIRLEPLHLAASQGRMEAVKFFVEKKGWDVDRLNAELEVGFFWMPWVNGERLTDIQRHL
jgi:hypothetical protein